MLVVCLIHKCSDLESGFDSLILTESFAFIYLFIVCYFIKCIYIMTQHRLMVLSNCE